MYTRGGKSTVEKPTLVNKPKIYKGRLGEVREARGGKSTKPKNVSKIVPECHIYILCSIWVHFLIHFDFNLRVDPTRPW